MAPSYKLDHREGKLKEMFEEQKICLEYENLECGDFQILNEEGEIMFIFERKSIDDLLASIKDGRYKNQKVKVLSQYKPHQLYYIIEGVVSFGMSSKVQDKIVQSSLINTLLRDKIGIFTTKNINETFALLRGIIERVNEDANKYFQPSQIESQTIVLSSLKDDETKIFKNMLCQLPGLSDKSAQAITERWKCWKEMSTELSLKTEQERLQILHTIKIGGARKLGKRIIESIIKHML